MAKKKKSKNGDAPQGTQLRKTADSHWKDLQILIERMSSVIQEAGQTTQDGDRPWAEPRILMRVRMLLNDASLLLQKNPNDETRGDVAELLRGGLYWTFIVLRSKRRVSVTGCYNCAFHDFIKNAAEQANEAADGINDCDIEDLEDLCKPDEINDKAPAAAECGKKKPKRAKKKPKQVTTVDPAVQSSMAEPHPAREQGEHAYDPDISTSAPCVQQAEGAQIHQRQDSADLMQLPELSSEPGNTPNSTAVETKYLESSAANDLVPSPICSSRCLREGSKDGRTGQHSLEPLTTTLEVHFKAPSGTAPTNIEAGIAEEASCPTNSINLDQDTSDAQKAGSSALTHRGRNERDRGCQTALDYLQAAEVMPEPQDKAWDWVSNTFCTYQDFYFRQYCRLRKTKSSVELRVPSTGY